MIPNCKIELLFLSNTIKRYIHKKNIAFRFYLVNSQVVGESTVEDVHLLLIVLILLKLLAVLKIHHQNQGMPLACMWWTQMDVHGQKIIG
jgi:hypothetical protein